MKKLLIVMVLGASAVAASAQGQETCSARQKGSAKVATKSGDSGYVPGLQQGVFRNGRYNVNFSATCAEADRFSHTLGTILADVNQTRTSCQIRNDLTGTLEKWPSWAAILYEGEMYFEGGQEYNFFGCVDDLAACELDGKCFWCVGLQQVNNLGIQVFSKKFEESGWRPIRVWLMDIGWDRGAESRRVGFQGMGIGWNTNGCKVVNTTTCLQWNRLLDDGSGRLLRSRVMPQESARQDENGPMGTKEGDVRMFGVRDGLPFEIEMVWVDGCKDVDGFWVSKNRVTHRQWKCIMGYDPVDKNMQGEDSPIGLACMGWGGDYLFIWGLNARYSGAGRFDRLSGAQWQLAAKYASVDLPTEAASLRLAFRPTDRRNREREGQKQIKGESDAAFEAKLANGEGRRYSLAKGLDLDVIRVEGCGETFYLGRYEVTVEQYEKVMTSNPSIWSGADNLPVGSVDWTNATVFCEKLNALVPVEGMVWALPTSKQWAFVANGGLKKQGNTFFGGNNWEEVGWWGGDEFGHNYVRPVGLKKPNELGFHDLFGNAWEWCCDGDGRKDFRYLGGPGVGHAGGRRLVESFYSGRMKDAASDWGLRVALVKSSERRKRAQEGKAVAANNRMKRPGLLGGSLRARRLQRQQAAQQVEQKKESVDGYTWSYRVNNGEATIVAENRGRFSCAVSPSPKGSLTIPSTLGGAKVTGIGRAALANCKDLVSVTMPPTVTSIGRDAFNGCHGVTSLAIPSSVKDIGIGAFLGCGVSSATISSNVVNIGYAAFAECAELKQINVDEGNQKYVSVDGVLYTKDRTVLIQCPGAVESVTLSEGMKNIYGHSLRGCRKLKSVTIPHSVSEIGAWAFSRCAGLTSLTIPESVTRIGNNAFRECSGLRSVEMPKNMTSIAYAAFYDCDGLSSVTLPPYVKNIEGWAFGRCDGLKTVKMPECVTNIAGEAFRECGNLTSLSLPSSLTSIGNAAFRACTNLSSVTIPSNVASIGVAAFTDCTGLREIDVAADNPKYASVDGVLYTKDRTEAVMCPGALTSVALPESVTSIGPCAFEGCGELTSITMPECVTNIGPYTFKRCVKLTSLTIPEGVASIGRDALRECHGLTSLTLPNSMTNIGSAAIAHCDSLKLLTMPSNVTIIAAAAFSHCCKLESVTIPPAVKSIEPWTFDCCEGLTSVTIPDHVTSIKSCAFRACTNLMSVTMRGGCPDPQRDVFKGCGKLKAIHVPSNSLSWAKMKVWQGIPLVFDGEAMSQEKLVQEAERLAHAAAEKARAEAERAQREAERAEQRQQLLAIQEELKRVREQKAAAAVKGGSATASQTSNASASGVNVVAQKLQSCDFLLNKDFKKNAKFYLCLFSASWCPPCRREMPRIAKTYAETLKDDPDIELIHFSRDQNDEKAMAWAKEHDVKFPVVKPKGGNPLDLHSRGIPHLFIVKADGTLVEEGHPMRIFNEEKFKELKSK